MFRTLTYAGPALNTREAIDRPKAILLLYLYRMGGTAPGAETAQNTPFNI